MSLPRTLLPLFALIALPSCIIHISDWDDDIAPSSPEVTEVEITTRASVRLRVVTPYDAETGVEGFAVTLSDTSALPEWGAAEQFIESTELWGDPQWLAVTGMRPGVERYIHVAAVDYAGNRSDVHTIGPITTSFAYSGALLPTHPEDGDNALGYRFASGDFDGDGYSDIAVAAPFKEAAGVAGAGAVHIHRGGATGIAAEPDMTISGDEAYAQLGNAVVALDWNGDETIDLAVGAPFADQGNGAIYIYDGARLAGVGEITGAPDAVIRSDGSGWYGTAAIGFTLAAVDFDGDGALDLATGAVAGGGTGGVLVIASGGWGDIVLSETSPTLGTSVTRLISPTPSELFGIELARVPGATRADGIAIAGFQTGRVVLKVGAPFGPTGAITDLPWHPDRDLEIDGSTLGAEAYVGAALGAMLTDDGHALVIGAYRANDGAGAVALVPTDLTGQVELADVATTLIAGELGSQLGSAIASNATAETADVDGDGTEDLVIVGGRGELEMLVWFGDDLPTGETTAASAHTRLTAPLGMVGDLPSIGGSPSSAAWVGDVDGDGLEDLAWSDWTANGADGLFELLR